MVTFVLVHGAGHGGWCWRRVVPLLRDAGHEVFVPTLTGLGERAHLAHPTIDLDAHIQDVVGVFEYEDLDHVVLVGHSYAGMVIAGVADRLPERIEHLVHLDSAEAANGQALLDLFAPDSQRALRDEVAADGDGWRLPQGDPAFYDVTDPDDAAWVGAKLGPQPFRTFTQPLRLAHPDGFAGPKTYIACIAVAPAVWRDVMIARARAEPGWNYRELETGHDAMVTAPKELAELLLEAARSTSPDIAG